MACTATVTATGLIAAIATVETQQEITNIHLQGLLDILQEGTSGTWPLTKMAVALTTIATAMGTIAGAIASGKVQIVITELPAGLSDDLLGIANTICKDGYVLPLADRVSADVTPSVAQRIVQAIGLDPPFGDLGAIGDRMGPTPSDAQCQATDAAWAPEPGTANIAEAIDQLGYLGSPVPGGL